MDRRIALFIAVTVVCCLFERRIKQEQNLQVQENECALQELSQLTPQTTAGNMKLMNHNGMGSAGYKTRQSDSPTHGELTPA